MDHSWKSRYLVRAAAAAFVALAVSLALVGGAGPAGASPRSRMLRLTNGARTSRGIAPLHLSRHLSRLAVQNSRENSASGTLSHSGSGKAENAGYGPSLRAIHKAFMSSGVHRGNILSGSFHRVGVGVASGGGSRWVTLIFV